MSAQIIDGEIVAAQVKDRLKQDVAAMKAKGVSPKLVAVMATENKGAHIYAKNQAKSCNEVGIEYALAELPDTSTEAEVIAEIERQNADSAVSGIIIQMPLPEGVDARKLQRMIAPAKDVEGMNPSNQGMVVYCAQPFLRKPAGDDPSAANWLADSLGWPLPSPAPCTPTGAMLLLRSLNVDLYGKEAVVIGHSEIVGKPMALYLMAHFCTTTVCHIATRDLASHVRSADIVVAAAGVPGLIKANMIKPGAIVIDIAINRIAKIGPDGKPELSSSGKPKMVTVGDVEFDKAKEIASYITPVPGGVGPMTVAMLLSNTVTAARNVAGL